MKICTTCNKTLPEENFSWKVLDVRRSSMCKACHKSYRRNHYLANKDKYIAKARKWESENGKLYSPAQIYIYEYFSYNPCVECGEKRIPLLQFDHIDPKTKLFNISNKSKEWNALPVIIEEIKKCQILCVVCHTLKTSEEQHWYEWYDGVNEKYKNQYKPIGLV